MSSALGVWLVAAQGISRGGLRWGDVAIGAIAALGLMFVLLGIGLAIRFGRRRQRAEMAWEQRGEEVMTERGGGEK